MKVRFRLSNPKNKKSGVKLDFSNIAFKNNRFLYGCGIEVITKYWNTNAFRAREIGGYSGEASRINERLDLLEAKLKNYVAKHNELTKEGLKEYLDSKTGVKAKKKQSKVNKEPYFQEWALLHLKTNRQNHKKSTVQAKTNTINLLTEFKPRIKFTEFDVELWEAFKDWLEDTKDYIHNSIWKEHKNVKAMLRYADEKEDIKVHRDYKKGLFNMPQVEVDNIYLNEEELSTLASLDLSKQPPKYAQARNMFLFGCWTGFRYSDIFSFSPSDIIEIKGKQRIKKKQQKGGKEVFIPILEQVKPYLHEHTLSNPELNEVIKKVAELAELKDWELIKAHTSRRSFSSNLYKRGIPVNSIMRLTGHSKLSTFLRYIKISPEEHAELTELDPYFE